MKIATTPRVSILLLQLYLNDQVSDMTDLCNISPYEWVIQHGDGRLAGRLRFLCRSRGSRVPETLKCHDTPVPFPSSEQLNQRRLIRSCPLNGKELCSVQPSLQALIARSGIFHSGCTSFVIDLDLPRIHLIGWLLLKDTFKIS